MVDRPACRSYQRPDSFHEDIVPSELVELADTCGHHSNPSELPASLIEFVRLMARQSAREHYATFGKSQKEQ